MMARWCHLIHCIRIACVLPCVQRARRWRSWRISCRVMDTPLARWDATFSPRQRRARFRALAPVLCTLNLPTCNAFAAIQRRELVHDLYHPESSYHHDHDARSDEHLLGVRSAPKPLQWPAKELRHLIRLPTFSELPKGQDSIVPVPYSPECVEGWNSRNSKSTILHRERRLKATRLAPRRICAR
jgi:hypothetical protein